jgi:hypothetical protein
MRFSSFALVLVLALIHGGCFVGTTLEMVKSQAGTVTLTSSALGDRTVAFACTSGDANSSWGPTSSTAKGSSRGDLRPGRRRAPPDLFRRSPLEEGVLPTEGLQP